MDDPNPLLRLKNEPRLYREERRLCEQQLWWLVFEIMTKNLSCFVHVVAEEVISMSLMHTEIIKNEIIPVPKHERSQN